MTALLFQFRQPAGVTMQLGNNSIFISVLTLVFITLGGCTWVKPIENADSVSLASLTEVENCARLGTTTSSVKDQIGWFNRGEEKVATELLTLAQNAATAMGGNRLVANGEPTEGSQQFIVFSCAD